MAETTERLMAATMLPEMTVGEVFDEWPRHMTILPWFHLPAKRWELFDARVHDLLEENCQFRVLGSHEDYFSPDRDVRVARLGLAGFAIHAGLYMFAKTHGEIESEDYAGLAWSPHISVSPEVDTSEFENAELSNITIIKKRRKKGDKIVKAVYRWEE